MASCSKIERLLVKYVNGSRSRRHIGKLKLRTNARSISRNHSSRMAERGKIWHGHGVSNLVKTRAYVGENVAMGPIRKRSKEVARDLHRCWMRSPGHKSNILNPGYKEIGIGVKRGKKGYYATQLCSEGE